MSDSSTAYLDTVRPMLHLVCEVFLAGRFGGHGAALLLPNLVAQFMRTTDMRYWNKIRAWASDLAARL